jgi:hypothetical protein
VEVFSTEEEHAVALLAITSCTSDFLRVPLETGWKVVVDDVADVSFVDPHAESDCSTDDHIFRGHELVLAG